jgi:hypothetical protein
VGATPAARALDDAAPQRDRADHPVDAERVRPAAPLEVGSPWGSETRFAV